MCQHHPSGRSVHPVQTKCSSRPDVWQLWFGRACNKEGNCWFYFNRPDDCLSWSRLAHYRYGNCVLKNSHPDARKPYKEITCSGHTTVWTMCHQVRMRPLNMKDFPQNFWKIFSHSCLSGRPMSTVPTAPRYILPNAHLSPQPINRGPWALRTARIRSEFQ